MRPGMMGLESEEVETAVVRSTLLFKAMTVEIIIFGKKISQHWRKYRREDEGLRIQPHSSTESLEELDSPGSRLDGVFALRDRREDRPEVVQ